MRMRTGAPILLHRLPPRRGGKGPLLDELRRSGRGQGPPLHAALRPRGHAPLPV